MRTAVFVVAGFALFALLLSIARAFKPSLARASGIAVPSFIVLWAVAAGTNMWMALSRPNNSLMAELPTFLIIFLLPVTAALFAKWNWR